MTIEMENVMRGTASCEKGINVFSRVEFTQFTRGDEFTQFTRGRRIHAIHAGRRTHARGRIQQEDELTTEDEFSKKTDSRNSRGGDGFTQLTLGDEFTTEDQLTQDEFTQTTPAFEFTQFTPRSEFTPGRD